MTDAADGFVSRWSQRKARVQSGAADVAAAPQPAPTDAVAVPAVHAETRPSPEVPSAPLPTMDDVALLTRGSDYSRFVGPGVDPGVSNAAMKKLFSDPRYNVMDGLDTYIDDYGRPDPIPLSTLRQMSQSKMLGLFAADEDEECAPPASIAGPPALAPAIPAPLLDRAPAAGASQPSPNDDADLRLQQDDAARRPGARPGAWA